ncbi:MAG TPA: hypothetical protein VMS55_16355 [Myxococcota bacterium]|nr:hypothetical protein [Myxococcota bacterium]
MRHRGGSPSPLRHDPRLGRVRFEIYQAASCEVVGPSPIGSCSRGRYSGDLEGTGYYATQKWEPLTPEGMVYVSENEVLRLAAGDLHGRVNAVFHNQSRDREVASLHTIIGGTGRYAGASGYIRLWRVGGELFEYEAVIHLADTIAETP